MIHETIRLLIVFSLLSLVNVVISYFTMRHLFVSLPVPPKFFNTAPLKVFEALS